MHRRLTLTLCLLLGSSFLGCGMRQGGGADPTIVHDQSTPEGAILCLEDAYRSEDLEAAIRCKDFQREAEIMLASINEEMGSDSEVIQQAAKVLELGFRAEIEQEGFPDFHGVISSFSNKIPYDDRDDMVQITETCSLPGGQSVSNVLVLAKSDEGWKVVTVVD